MHYEKSAILYEKKNSEKYSRGRRGAPAKGIGRVTGARVRIPLSPLLKTRKKEFKKIQKKELTNRKTYDILIWLSQESKNKKEP